MCTVCGCGEGEVQIESRGKDGHAHAHGHAHEHAHVHSHAEGGAHEHVHDYGTGPARAHAPGLSQSRMVEIEENILDKNNQYAQANRRWLREHGVLALNLVSSPGSGKTSLLTRTIDELRATSDIDVTVIEGDQQTANDAERIRATGAQAVQINTGKGCHLDGHMVGHAIESLAPADDSLLFVENVGNLVCPAAFDLGENHKVVILSVTEGADKPLKYPDMFAAADLMLVNKIDLLPYVEFDVDACVENARKINPGIRVLTVSATTGEGMKDWYAWIRAAQQFAKVGA